MDNNLVYKIALSMVPGIGGVLARNLVSYCGGAESVFKSRKKKLLQIPGIGPKMANSILASRHLFLLAEKELNYATKNGIAIIDHLNPNYPNRLVHTATAPYLLYTKGTGNLNPERTVAIVGTRKPTKKGETSCRDIVFGLQQYGVSVISGLAYGVDIIAHKACLESGIPTYGVMGNGFGKIYPSAHLKTAREMLASGGLITEYGYEIGPDRENFPARNRIISGMADAIVVIESAEKGGSMITAVFGNEYNKDVFAVPGKPQDTMSKGCNYLIKMQQASLCESAEDIAYTMGWDLDASQPRQKDIFVELDHEEKKILDLITLKEEAGMDYLSYETTIPQSQLSTLLLNLEFKGCIKALPGKRFTTL